MYFFGCCQLCFWRKDFPQKFSHIFYVPAFVIAIFCVAKKIPFAATSPRSFCGIYNVSFFRVSAAWDVVLTISVGFGTELGMLTH